MTRSSRLSVALSLLLLALATPAGAALSKAQQSCVNAENASWLKLAAASGKTTLACIASHADGASGTIASCVAADEDGKIATAVDQLTSGYDGRCVGVDADGQSKLPAVFVTDVDSVARAGRIEAARGLAAVFGTDVEGAAVTDAVDADVAACQAAVAKTVAKCAEVRRKSFNACKKRALAVGKEPFPVGATTPAELATCFDDDPKGAIAKACAAPGAPGDKIRQALGKRCANAGVDLASAFPQCASASVDVVHDCLDAPGICAVCQAVNGVDVLAIDCDAADDGAANGSCTPPAVLVPAYGNPCCGDGPAMWSSLAAAAGGSIALHVILNPASGPGAGPQIDPNYVDSGPVGPLLAVRAAGAKIYGYVSTSFATRLIGDAEADVDLWYTPSFWRGAGVQLDGIFFDEMSSDLPDVGYYQQLRDYVHAKDPSAVVIANPGQPATQDSSGGSSGFTVMDYATAADVLVTFEGTGSDYRTAYAHPAWVNALPASHFAHLVHGEANAADMAADLELARARKAGMMYVTDDVLVPNPWDALATYWAGELDLLRVP